MLSDRDKGAVCNFVQRVWAVNSSDPIVWILSHGNQKVTLTAREAANELATLGISVALPDAGLASNYTLDDASTDVEALECWPRDFKLKVRD